MNRLYRDKTDGTLWRVVRDDDQYLPSRGEMATVTTLRGSDGTEIRLTPDDEDEWNQLQRISQEARS